MPLTFHIREEETHDSSLLASAPRSARKARKDAARQVVERFLAQQGAFAKKPVQPPGEEPCSMQAKIDPVLCTGCGLCAKACPAVFEMAGDRARVKLPSVPRQAEPSCLHAMQSCPVEALSLEV